MTRKADLETVRAAFRIAGLADGGIESFDDVGLELLWQIAEIRERVAGYETQANEDLAISVRQTAEINRLKAQQERKPDSHDAFLSYPDMDAAYQQAIAEQRTSNLAQCFVKLYLEAQQERKPMTDERKKTLVSDWFAEDWAQENALKMLADYDVFNGIKETP